MKYPFPEDPAEAFEHPSEIERLMYNRPSQCLVAVVSRELENGPRMRRLYYRRLPREAYQPVPVREEWESQQDAHCCEVAPFLVYSEWWLQPMAAEPPPEYLLLLHKGKTPDPTERSAWGMSWIGIRRFNLHTGQDERVLDMDAFSALPGNYSDVCQLMSVSADGSGAIGIVSLAHRGSVKYLVFELSLVGGPLKQITEAPDTFF